ncbi:hypothetical protein BV20DRAFT_675276 [Pilatotrama ljubarskyi]|nr:hypothetical protein BV20DRAFT_675276 [Pilatotrama ljubarskyi]
MIEPVVWALWFSHTEFATRSDSVSTYRATSMPISTAKATASYKKAKRHQPYGSPETSSSKLRQQPRALRLAASMNADETSADLRSTSSVPAASQTATASGSRSSPAPILPLPATRSIRAPLTIRDLSLRVIRNKYPYFTPRNDWEILLLSSALYKGAPDGIYNYLDSKLASELRRCSYEEAMEDARKMLDEAADCTGLKPEPGDPHVFVHPIPNSEYSIRLFPGSVEGRDYCLDFLPRRA